MLEFFGFGLVGFKFSEGWKQNLSSVQQTEIKRDILTVQRTCMKENKVDSSIVT